VYMHEAAKAAATRSTSDRLKSRGREKKTAVL
jgi:hypothetical protein